jgi:RimJ/RimL family protein N-acetyltransferase
MTGRLRFRTASIDDATAIARLLEAVATDSGMLLQAPGEPIDPRQVANFLAVTHGQDRGVTIVAEIDAAPAGVLMAYADEKRECAGTVALALAVAQPWRGQGLGSTLLTAVDQWAAAHPGVWRLELSVFAANHAAQRLYQRMGFQPEGVRRNNLADGQIGIDEVFMGKLVNPPASYSPSPASPTPAQLNLYEVAQAGPDDAPYWCALGENDPNLSVLHLRRSSGWRRRHVATLSILPDTHHLLGGIWPQVRAWAAGQGLTRLETSVFFHQSSLISVLTDLGFQCEVVRRAAAHLVGGYIDVVELAYPI